MTAGLPGTGIGGLFYLLLVLWMPVRALLRWMGGRSHGTCWRTVTRLLVLATTILAALWGVAWLLFQVLGVRGASALEALGASAAQAALAARAAAVATLASLAFALAVVTVLRLCVSRPPPVACSAAGSGARRGAPPRRAGATHE